MVILSPDYGETISPCQGKAFCEPSAPVYRAFKQHVGVDRAQSTYRKYDNVRKRLAEFLREKLHREDIPLKELTETFITEYDLYLRSEKGLTPSCVCIYTKPLKTIVTKARNDSSGGDQNRIQERRNTRKGGETDFVTNGNTIEVYGM